MALVFTDTTNKRGFLQRFEYWTRQDYESVTGDDLKTFTEDLNAEQHMMYMELISASDDWNVDDPNHADLNILTTALTTNRDVTIPVTEEVLSIDRVDITYDGTNWYQAHIASTAEFNIGLGNDSLTDNSFTIENPVVTFRGNSCLVHPIATSAQVAAGATIRFEWTREAENFSSTGDDTKRSFLPSAFDEILAKRVALNWLYIHKSDREDSLIGKLERDVERGRAQMIDWVSKRLPGHSKSLTSVHNWIT